MHRGIHLRLLAGLIVLAGAGALAGCGTGQVAATANIVPAVPGANADVIVPGANGGLISVRNATVDFPGVAGYAAGSTAPLNLQIFNQTTQVVTLTRVVANFVSPTGSATSAGTVTTSGAPEASACGSPPPIAIPAASGSASESPAPGEVNPSASGVTPSGSVAPPSTSATPAPSVPVTTSGPISMPIPPAGCVILSQGQGAYLALTGLTEALMPGDTVNLIFNFTLANGASVKLGTTRLATNPSATPQPIEAPIAPPATPAPRASLSLGSPPNE